MCTKTEFVFLVESFKGHTIKGSFHLYLDSYDAAISKNNLLIITVFTCYKNIYLNCPLYIISFEGS